MGTQRREETYEKIGTEDVFGYVRVLHGFKKKDNGGIDQYGYAVRERNKTAREEHEQRSIF
jgi:hypothetical protein